MPWKKLHDGNVFSDPTYGKNALWHHPTDPSRGKKKQHGSVLDMALFFNLSYNTEDKIKGITSTSVVVSIKQLRGRQFPTNLLDPLKK